MKKRTKPEHNPLGHIKWVDPDTLFANDYNPNHVFGPELELLRTSLLENGWTQPVVAQESGEIVDGFHRTTLAQRDKSVRALGGGKVPVVYVAGQTDRAEQMMATIRHNRARGKHSVILMGNIARSLVDDHGYDVEDLMHGLGMEREEVLRLLEVGEMPDVQGREVFGKAWVPDK
tara:strand:+ start:1354 stop:1878 length:525 start_codon:yes stop_codon:yes gene_type:complete